MSAIDRSNMSNARSISASRWVADPGTPLASFGSRLGEVLYDVDSTRKSETFRAGLAAYRERILGGVPASNEGSE